MQSQTGVAITAAIFWWYEGKLMLLSTTQAAGSLSLRHLCSTLAWLEVRRIGVLKRTNRFLHRETINFLQHYLELIKGVQP
jgi:hypothetical protein